MSRKYDVTLIQIIILLVLIGAWIRGEIATPIAVLVLAMTVYSLARDNWNIWK